MVPAPPYPVIITEVPGQIEPRETESDGVRIFWSICKMEEPRHPALSEVTV